MAWLLSAHINGVAIGPTALQFPPRYHLRPGDCRSTCCPMRQRASGRSPAGMLAPPAGTQNEGIGFG